MPWFWQGDLQGGGVLNDMMCHSALVVRHLLTARRAAREREAGARHGSHRVASSGRAPSTRKRSAKTMGTKWITRSAPSEDFAGVTIEFETERRLHGDRRSDDIVELRRRRPASLRRVARSGVFDEMEFARHGTQLFLAAP